MINLKHKYALLEDGTVEPLYYKNGEPREAFQDEDGKCYLVHDRLIRINGANSIAFCHLRIIATADDIKEFEEQNDD